MRAHLSDPPEKLAIDISGIGITEDVFYQLCRDNPELRFELTEAGELIVVTPVGSKSGHRESRIIQRLVEWADLDGTGLAFSSSAGFTLPNGAKRLPDASWIRSERWNALSPAEQEGYARLCPDFVIELRSPSDRIGDLKNKMREYVSNGARLGWLLDPYERRVWIYRPGSKPLRLDDPAILESDTVVPGFRLDFREIL